MACPTVIDPPWLPPGWQPATIPPSETVQIVLTSGGIPNGASMVFIQLSVKSPATDSAIAAMDGSGANAHAFSPVRSQVANLYNDTLAFAPVDSSNAIYIHNYDGVNTVSVEVKVFGYT